MNPKAQKAYDTAVEIAKEIYCSAHGIRVEQHCYARKYMLGCISTLYSLELINDEEYDMLCKDYKKKFPY